MRTTRQAILAAALLLMVAAAGFLFLRRSSDTPQFAVQTSTVTATTATIAAAPGGTVTEPDEPAVTTTTTTVTDPDDPAAATSPVPDAPTGTVADPADPDDPASTTATTVPARTVPMPPEPDGWWEYNPELEWPVTDPDRLFAENVYPDGMISDAVEVARQVEAFWAWYMTWGHPQGVTLDLSAEPNIENALVGDAVGQLMYLHHRFWQQRLPVWDEVWNREFDTAREQQRNKLIYLDSLGELNRGVDGSVGPPTLLYNPADETSVWRYWGPIIRPVPNPTAPRRYGEMTLPDDVFGACGPRSESAADWGCVHLGPAETGPALGEWDVSWYYDIPHGEAAWYVYTRESARAVRYDPAVHGAPTVDGGQATVDDGELVYLPATVADGAYYPSIVDALKPYRPEGFPDDPAAFRERWRSDVGGGWWHKEMGQLVLLVPADELVAWLEDSGYDPQDMFAAGWPNPGEERLIRSTWGRDWDRTDPGDWRNRLSVGWLEQGVEIGDSGNLAADIEAAIHISAWMDWAYRTRVGGDRLPSNDLTRWWNESAWAPDGIRDGPEGAQDAWTALFGHRSDGWAAYGDVWQGLYYQALADGYQPDAATGRLTHPALNPELLVWKEWAAAGEAGRYLGFQAAAGESPLGPVPGETWIPWYPEAMVPLEDHYLLPEGAVGHWETVVDWWPDEGLEMPVHQPDWYHAFTVVGPYVAEGGGHMFETCLWATGGLFAAWSLPHPQLEDASQNVTWIVRGIADRSGRIVELAEPVNRPCIDWVNRWQHEGQVPHRGPTGFTFEEWMVYVRTPLHERIVEDRYNPDTGLWTEDDRAYVKVPSELFDDGIITLHGRMWFVSVADAATAETGSFDGVLEPSYEDWQQWEAASIATARVDYGGSDLPLGHHRYVLSGWEQQRQTHAEGAANVFNELSPPGAVLDTPTRYTDWVLGGVGALPEEFMRSTYRIVSRHRQPATMHWLYNDGTAVQVDAWALPESDWQPWSARREAETLHTGVVITPLFVRRGETDRTIPAGHIGTHSHNDWSWTNVEMRHGATAPDGTVLDGAVWATYLTSCMEEGFPALSSRNGWKDDLFTGWTPEAADVPVWAWPGVLELWAGENPDVAQLGWPQWTWENHPDIALPRAPRIHKLSAADCAGIAAGDYTPDYIYPYPGIGNYPVWMSALGHRPPESWSVTDSPFDE